MANMKAKYLGGLRCECTHLASGNTILTDAPVDNKGKGEAFSPTDLCTSSLAACIMTIMGIYAQEHGFSVDGIEASITKEMAANPRRIGKITIDLTMPNQEYTDKQKKALEHCAHVCPVHQSLHPDTVKEINFIWQK